MGLTTGGAIGAETALTLATACRASTAGGGGAQGRKDVIVLCHGGPIAQPADAAYISTAARLPRLLRGFQHGASADEVAIVEQTRQFKRIERRREAARGRWFVTGSQEWREAARVGGCG
jgi:predicted TIM-barrel enzyme